MDRLTGLVLGHPMTIDRLLVFFVIKVRENIIAEEGR
jgi:hypothetical protein